MVFDSDCRLSLKAICHSSTRIYLLYGPKNNNEQQSENKEFSFQTLFGVYKKQIVSQNKLTIELTRKFLYAKKVNY